MRVKRFNNLWTMGLILFGVILVAFYIAKIFFPEFIVGVAEIPSIVKLGNYVDSHKWASILFHFVVGTIGGYIYCCACCRVKILTLRQTLVFVAFSITSQLLQRFQPKIYTPYTYVILVLVPFVLSRLEKNIRYELFVSTSCCFSIDIMSQALSLVIRDVFTMTTAINSATLTILLIDTWIWRILLYLFFNNKN